MHKAVHIKTVIVITLGRMDEDSNILEEREATAVLRVPVESEFVRISREIPQLKADWEQQFAAEGNHDGTVHPVARR